MLVAVLDSHCVSRQNTPGHINYICGEAALCGELLVSVLENYDPGCHYRNGDEGPGVWVFGRCRESFMTQRLLITFDQNLAKLLTVFGDVICLLSCEDVVSSAAGSFGGHHVLVRRDIDVAYRALADRMGFALPA